MFVYALIFVAETSLTAVFCFCFVVFGLFSAGSNCICPLIGTETVKAVEGKMESVRHQSDKYKSKSPSETQMQTSGDGRDRGGWMGGGGGVKRREGEQRGKSLSLPNLTRLSNVFKGKQLELVPLAADRKRIDLNGRDIKSCL